MDGRVLVTYGSRMGSTAEIAAEIARTLRARGYDVTLKPADQVHSAAPYEAVILGSAIYAGRWRRDALDLLEREVAHLRGRQVWLFQSGLSVIGGHADPGPTPAKVAALADAIGVPRPVTFAGCLIPATARGLLPRLMARLSPSRGDHRDWDAIRAWSAQVADQLIEAPAR